MQTTASNWPIKLNSFVWVCCSIRSFRCIYSCGWAQNLSSIEKIRANKLKMLWTIGLNENETTQIKYNMSMKMWFKNRCNRFIAEIYQTTCVCLHYSKYRNNEKQFSMNVRDMDGIFVCVCVREMNFVVVQFWLVEIIPTIWKKN